MKHTTRKDISIPQGDVFRIVVTVVDGPTSLAGYVGEMQIRKTKSSTETLAEMNDEWFTIDDINRQVVLEIPETATVSYDWIGSAVYDMHIVGPDRWRLIEGKVCLNKAVTQEA